MDIIVQDVRDNQNAVHHNLLIAMIRFIIVNQRCDTEVEHHI